MPAKVRVRFAPSPTGSLHIGGARTALFNWLFARHNHGTFILRIEDTDQQRSTPEALAAIVDGLKWLGVDWDEGPEIGGEYGPYNQMARLEIYQREAMKLLENKAVYKCFCTPEEVAAMREEARQKKENPRYNRRCRDLTGTEVEEREKQGMPFVLRFRVPEGATGFDDMVRGHISFDNVEIDDFIIQRSDGTPMYNFSVSVDDVSMKITHVIRGEDHISNTPKQILLLQAMGAELPEYAHVSLIMGEDGARLSKRHGATAVGAYDELGYLPEAMMNYLALLGWSPKDDREIMGWIVDRIVPVLLREGLMDESEAQSKRDWLLRLASATKERLHYLTDIAPNFDYFFRDVESYDEKGVKKRWKKPEAMKMLSDLVELLEECEPFDEKTIEARCMEYIGREGAKLGELAHPARLALTGKTIGAGIFETIELVGKERSLQRLQKAIEYIETHTLGK